MLFASEQADGCAARTDFLPGVRDASKHPSIVFRFLKDGVPVVFNTYAAGTVTEMMDGFVNSPSVYFAYAVPQDGAAVNRTVPVVPVAANASAMAHPNHCSNQRLERRVPPRRSLLRHAGASSRFGRV